MDAEKRTGMKSVKDFRGSCDSVLARTYFSLNVYLTKSGIPRQEFPMRGIGLPDLARSSA